MNITKEQYVELVEKLAEELIGDQMEKTAKVDDQGRHSYFGIKTVDYYPEYGTSEERGKIIRDARNAHRAEDMIGGLKAGTIGGAGIGAVGGGILGAITRKPANVGRILKGTGIGAGAGAAYGALAGLYAGDNRNWRRGMDALYEHDDAVSEQRYADDPQALADAKKWGPQYADRRQAKRAEKTAKTRNDFEEYDGVGDAGKRIGKYIGGGAVLGGAAGAVAGKSPAAAGLGAYYGAGIGALGGTLHQTIRDDKSAKRRYADDPKALRDARLLGPQFADYRKQKRTEKTAGEIRDESKKKGTRIGAGIGAGLVAIDTPRALMAGKALGMPAGTRAALYASGAIPTIAIGAGIGRAIGSHQGKKREQLIDDVKSATKEAAEALFEAVLYKQAAIQEKAEAELIAEASEKALNALGYSMFAK